MVADQLISLDRVLKEVVIIGSGAVAAELTSAIDDNNEHVDGSERINIIGYLDSQSSVDLYWRKYKFQKKVISDVESFDFSQDVYVIIGLANVKYKKMLILNLIDKAKFINFIHFSSIIDKNSIMGVGNIIYPFCMIGPNTVIGSFNLLTSYGFISHDCVIGDCNFFSTSGLSGHVKVGNANFFGIRSTVLPNVEIGSDNTIQAGMIVDKSVGDNTTVFYRYKEKCAFISTDIC